MSYQELAMRTNSHSFYPYAFKASIMSQLRSFILESRDLDYYKRNLFYSGQPEGAHESGSTRFLSPDFAKTPEHSIEIIHGIVGIATESGELIEALENAINRKEIDKTNIIEEMGDVCWYLALLCKALDVTLDEVQAINIAKLAKRYPLKFESELAHNRNLDLERQVLEEGVNNGE